MDAHRRRAYRAVHGFSRLLRWLERGDLTVRAFQRVLRAFDDLDIECLRAADEFMDGWDFGMLPDTFHRNVSELAQYLTSWAQIAEDDADAPEYGAAIEMPDPSRPGTMTLTVTAPMQHRIGFSARLDEAARSVLLAQKTALRDGTPIPLDPDGAVERTGEPLTLNQIRAMLIMTADFSAENVRINHDRFRIVVNVPMLTLLGMDELPASIDGMIPVPADVARDWAAGSEEWFRILTDPVTGRVLDVPAARYVPSPQMLDMLRLRKPICAYPGCRLRTHARSEADHIEEFNHQDPESGGRTELDNLHLLCIRHHQVKTARQVDPIRYREGSPGPTENVNRPGFRGGSVSWIRPR